MLPPRSRFADPPTSSFGIEPTRLRIRIGHRPAGFSPGGAVRAAPSLRCSTGFGVALAEVLVEVLLADAVGLPDPHRGQLTGLDEAVHRHRRDAHVARHFGDREEPRLGWWLCHVLLTPSPSCGTLQPG